MKKLISLTLVILMVFSLAITAMADTESTTAPETNETTATTAPAGTFENTRGSITLNNLTLENGKPTATYKVYQILKLNSFDFGSGSYYYTYTDDAWKTFFTTGAGADYIQVNNDNLIEWKGTNSAERVAEFARIALAYAQANSIPATADTLDTDDYSPTAASTIVFDDLDLGYYLVDSSVGSLCGLTTTNPNGIINSKNSAPTLDKQVEEDLSKQYGEVNSADIGQDVNFRITIHVHDGAQNYVLYDTMSEGLTFKHTTVKVSVLDGASGVPTEYDPVVGDVINYTVELNSLQEFKIKFSSAFCDNLDTNDRLIITYKAMLNRNAVVGNVEPANVNTAYLSYGEGHTTKTDTTTTYTYGFDLVKTDGQNKLLDGSEFRIYDAETGGNEVTVVPMLDENDQQITTPDGYNMYRKARADETGATVIVVNGKVRVVGLDNGIYFLAETKAPNGFNPIATRQKFTISDNNLDAIITGGIVSTNSGVQVVNHTGTMLPETGGMGTVLFITIGTILALGAGVVLVTKKRMANIAE